MNCQSMLNKLQEAEDFASLKDEVPPEYIEKVTAGTPEYLLEIMEQVIEILLSRLNVPQEEAAEFAGQVKERKMGELFANFKGYDVQATRAEARKEGLEEGLAKGLTEGLTKGLAEGLSEGLFAFVRTLKPILVDFDKVFDAVTGNKEYANTTREEVMKYYQMCP